MSVKESITNMQTGETVVVDMSAEDVAAREKQHNALAPIRLRAERDRLLAETDVYALADLTHTDEMRAYRQALRDLPANTSDLNNPTWPTKPS